MISRPLATLLLACACAGAADAQTVYRCGADGRSYSHQPCPNGRSLEIDDQRTSAQRNQADAAVKRDAKAAARLESERLRADRMAPKIASLNAAKPTAATGKPQRRPTDRRAKSKRATESNADFRAVTPQQAATKPRGAASSGPRAP